MWNWSAISDGRALASRCANFQNLEGNEEMMRMRLIQFSVCVIPWIVLEHYLTFLNVYNNKVCCCSFVFLFLEILFMIPAMAWRICMRFVTNKQKTFIISHPLLNICRFRLITEIRSVQTSIVADLRQHISPEYAALRRIETQLTGLENQVSNVLGHVYRQQDFLRSILTLYGRPPIYPPPY